MNMNKIYVSVLMAAVVALGAGAQEKLNKEITLDKDNRKATYLLAKE